MREPFTVPKGWTRGQKLRVMSNGQRYAIFQDWYGTSGVGEPTRVVEPDDIACIEFDSRADAQAFIDWWYAANPGSERDIRA